MILSEVYFKTILKENARIAVLELERGSRVKGHSHDRLQVYSSSAVFRPFLWV